MELYVIFTTGRTGSQLIRFNLSTHFQLPSLEYQHNNIEITQSTVIHNHNPLWVPPDNSFCTAIISRRRNLFESIISALVAEKTKEFFQYTNRTISPFYVEPLDFTHRYFFEKTYYEIINYNRFDKVVEVYYEDMMSDKKHLFSLVGVDKEILLDLTTKSPYNNRQLISNIDELDVLFKELQDTRPITDLDIENTRNSIHNDLLTARENQQTK
jgi:hypothetical protein